MKPANTDSPSQSARRKNAILGSLSSTLLRRTSAVVLLWLRVGLEPGSFLSRLTLLLIVLGIGRIPFIWISLKTRLKEIQGGEEDAAAQY